MDERRGFADRGRPGPDQDSGLPLKARPQILPRILLQYVSVRCPLLSKPEEVDDTPNGGDKGSASFRSSGNGGTPKLGGLLLTPFPAKDVTHSMVSHRTSIRLITCVKRDTHQIIKGRMGAPSFNSADNNMSLEPQCYGIIYYHHYLGEHRV